MEKILVYFLNPGSHCTVLKLGSNYTLFKFLPS